jgi:hypothetical protein
MTKSKRDWGSLLLKGALNLLSQPRVAQGRRGTGSPGPNVTLVANGILRLATYRKRYNSPEICL